MGTRVQIESWYRAVHSNRKVVAMSRGYAGGARSRGQPAGVDRPRPSAPKSKVVGPGAQYHADPAAPSWGTPASSGARRLDRGRNSISWGPVPGDRVLEIGGGAGQCARWLHRAERGSGGVDRPVPAGCSTWAPDRPAPQHTLAMAQCDAAAPPGYADEALTVMSRPYGGPFVADSATVMTGSPIASCARRNLRASPPPTRSAGPSRMCPVGTDSPPMLPDQQTEPLMSKASMTAR